MKIRPIWLVIMIILILAMAGLLIFQLNINQRGELLAPVASSTGQQNYSVAYDAGQKILLVGTNQNELFAFNQANEKLWSFTTKGTVRSMQIDSAGGRVFVGCEDRSLYILNLADGQLINEIKTQRRIYSIDINQDASLVLISAGVNTLKHNILIYKPDGTEVLNAPTGITCQSACFSSDGQSYFIASDRGEITHFDLTGAELGKVALSSELTGMTVVKSVHKIITTSAHNIVNVLNEDLSVEAEWRLYGEGMAVAADSKMNSIAVGNKEGWVYILDSAGKMVLEKKLDYSVTGLYFSESTLYVTGLADFLYQLNLDNLAGMSFINQFKSLAPYLFAGLGLMILITMIMAFDKLRDLTRRFFRALVKHRTAYLMLVPTFALLLVFNYFPVIIAFVRSFTNWSIQTKHVNEIAFIGFDNYIKMFTEGYFLIGLKNLGILFGTSIIKLLTVPLLVAEIVFLMKGARRKYWFRFAFVLPMVVPGIVSTLMWQRIYDPTIGLLNNVLRIVTGNPALMISWLGDERLAIWAIVFMGFPFINAFAFLVYYGGLIDIPTDLFEAAAVDGSSGWWNLTRIHLPLLTPQIKMLIILNFIGVVQDYGAIFILTGGGPGTATYVPGLELYYNATRFNQYGYACALGVTMFIFILAGTILNLRMKTEHAN
ncbi:MAG: ABC transporter permease subunit [Clostridiaceae bacterium]|nr:ABC transporter permease subunit [Clostridiaceae bacterium]